MPDQSEQPEQIVEQTVEQMVEQMVEQTVDQTVEQSPAWFIYLVRCHNGNLYTGISTDVARRFSEHQAGKGAKYLRGKGPLQLVYQRKIGSRSKALKAEIMVKKMSRQAKEKMIQAF